MTDGPKTYRIERADATVPLTGTVTNTPWAAANTATMDTYRWVPESPDDPATVRVLYDDAAVYCQYHVPDSNIAGEVTELNGPVYTDSSVEWFFDPAPDGPRYCNFEANCLGTFLLSWRRAQSDTQMVDEETAASIRVETSVSGPKAPAATDESWWLAAEVPFSALETLTGVTVDPGPGTTWRGNFHHIDSQETAAVGVWNPIQTDGRSLHSPEFFGDLLFA